MSDNAMLDCHAAMLVTQVLQEVRHVAGGAVNDGAAVVRVPLLVLRKTFLKTQMMDGFTTLATKTFVTR